MTTLAKDAFTRVWFVFIEVFNWVRLEPRLRKDALTMEFVERIEVFKVEILVSSCVTLAFICVNWLPRLRKDAFTTELNAVFTCVAVSVKDVFTV